MAVELEQEAEKAVGEVLQAWAAPCVDVVMGVVAKARAGLSDADFRAEVEVVLSGLAEMALTDDEVLVEALWDAGAQAYRAGWVANGDDVAGSKRNCHKPPGEPCREHPKGNGVRMLSYGEGKQEIKQRRMIVDKQKRTVVFDSVLRAHLIEHIQKKDRSVRVQDILFAHDTVKHGDRSKDNAHTGDNGEPRWLYEMNYELKGKEYRMQVVCEERESGKLEALTYFFKSVK